MAEGSLGYEGQRSLERGVSETQGRGPLREPAWRCAVGWNRGETGLGFSGQEVSGDSGRLRFCDVVGRRPGRSELS